MLWQVWENHCSITAMESAPNDSSPRLTCVEGAVDALVDLWRAVLARATEIRPPALINQVSQDADHEHVRKRGKLGVLDLMGS
jgi:hypothetical protein